MIIQSIVVDMCSCSDTCARNTAKTLDWVTAVALLVIGILAATGVLSLSPPLTYSFIGAGVVYTLVMLLRSSIDIRLHCSRH